MKKDARPNQYGIVFKLADIMKEKGYSKNKLCVKCNLRFETIQGYYKGNISRIDLYIISRLCQELDCNIQDLIEYRPDLIDQDQLPPDSNNDS